MIIPIRCYTCGKLIANKYDKFIKLKNEGKKTPQEILEKDLKITKYCCKRMLAFNVELIQEIN
jgi:DNA-directed RNA polymerase subunit N (RpoN/RPB10)